MKIEASLPYSYSTEHAVGNYPEPDEYVSNCHKFNIVLNNIFPVTATSFNWYFPFCFTQ
jgi:hypothetical protein